MDKAQQAANNYQALSCRILRQIQNVDQQLSEMGHKGAPDGLTFNVCELKIHENEYNVVVCLIPKKMHPKSKLIKIG